MNEFNMIYNSKSLSKFLEMVELINRSIEYYYWIWVEILILMVLRSWYVLNLIGVISNFL